MTITVELKDAVGQIAAHFRAVVTRDGRVIGEGCAATEDNAIYWALVDAR